MFEKIITNKIFIAVAGVVVIGAIGAGLYMKGDDNSNTEIVNEETEQTVSSNQTTNTTQSNQENKGGTIKDILAMTGSHKCTVNHSTDLGISNGVVYIDNSKIRADFSISAGGQNVKVHLIVRDGDTYTWMDGIPMAFKAPVSISDKPSTQTGGVDINQKLDYTCVSSKVDQSLFVVPTNINFKTI